jgi:hypothetical protein
VIPSSVSLRLMFSYDETMLAANLSRSKVIAAVDQRPVRKKHQKPQASRWVRFSTPRDMDHRH